MEIGIVCPFCGKEHFVVVDEEEFMAWESGELIQKAMPTLSATEREQLISHICPKCQEKIFGDEEEIDISDFEEEEEEDILSIMRESLEFTGQWW